MCKPLSAVGSKLGVCSCTCTCTCTMSCRCALNIAQRCDFKLPTHAWSCHVANLAWPILHAWRVGVTVIHQPGYCHKIMTKRQQSFDLRLRCDVPLLRDFCRVLAYWKDCARVDQTRNSTVPVACCFTQLFLRLQLSLYVVANQVLVLIEIIDVKLTSLVVSDVRSVDHWLTGVAWSSSVFIPR